jgi:hypothetical protein
MLRYRDGVGGKGEVEVARRISNDNEVGSHELEATGGGDGLKRRRCELYGKAVKGGPGAGQRREVGVTGSSLIIHVTSLTSRSLSEDSVRSHLIFLARCLLVRVVEWLVGVVARWRLRFKAAGSLTG